jgi:hypothetical protein
MDEQPTPRVLATLAIDYRSDGNVSVSGPIKDPILIMDVLGKALQAIANFQQEEKAGSIIQPKPSLVLPR